MEDELHFIFYCPLYATEREAFINDITRINGDINGKSDIEKLKLFMDNSSFGSYIKQCYFKRSDFIYNNI